MISKESSYLSVVGMRNRNTRFLNMINLKPFQVSFTIFYIFGLNPLISFADIRKRRSKILSILPRILNILVNAYFIYKLCEQVKNSTFLQIYARFALICVICVNAVGIFENLCNLRLTHQILQALSFTINSLEMALEVKYPFNALKKATVRKIVQQLMVVLVGSLIKYSVESINGVGWKKSVYWAISTVIKCVNLCHLTFYVDFMKFALASLNRRLVMLMIGNKTNWCHKGIKDLQFIVRQIKLIHFKLWHVSQCVNRLFGWFLVTYVIETASTSVYDIFWAFVLADQTDDQHIYILRKYLFEY